MKSLILEIIIQSVHEPIPTIEERSLLVVAYKNVLYDYSKAFRSVVNVQSRHENKGEDWQVGLCERFVKEIQEKTEHYCYEINEIIDQVLKVESLSLVDSVFYWKVKGDFFKYIYNVDYRFRISDWKAKALESYEKSYELINLLPCTNSIRLGLILNYSYFYSDIMFDVGKAISIARPEFDLAMTHIEELLEKQDEYGDERDAVLILQLLKDNLFLWSSETEIGPDDD
ncbi:predicted protein [Naegleria gruberi]|uniref:Predicted protein n=1 Tax=Naegleria gruberi TaxID=5762 RepID=D2VI47_NAEGR|nr:uncharacterized protein NAEGRDRAFT_34237 [Naegleria gruberi]EFC43527.1 predicted protein [Naegleria gruberi]|eukprot:XP_002676271.1 predicted protein [Naegleria gruberi strain NEG-M]